MNPDQTQSDLGLYYLHYYDYKLSTLADEGADNYFLVLKRVFFVLFVWFDSLRPINNLSVKQGWVFLGWTSTKLG